MKKSDFLILCSFDLAKLGVAVFNEFVDGQTFPACALSARNNNNELREPSLTGSDEQVIFFGCSHAYPEAKELLHKISKISFAK